MLETIAYQKQEITTLERKLTAKDEVIAGLREVVEKLRKLISDNTSGPSGLLLLDIVDAEIADTQPEPKKYLRTCECGNNEYMTSFQLLCKECQGKVLDAIMKLGPKKEVAALCGGCTKRTTVHCNRQGQSNKYDKACNGFNTAICDCSDCTKEREKA